MPPYLQDAQEYVTLLKDIVTALAAIIAAVVAIAGLKTWRRQLKGNTQYDLARRLLKSAYKLRDAIALVRNPFQSATEISHALKEAGSDVQFGDERYDLLSAQAVYQRRWKAVQAALTDLQIDSLEGEALWGEECRIKVTLLYRLVADLHSNLQMYLRNMERPPRNISGDSMDAIDSVVYETSGSSRQNLYSAGLDAAIHSIEDYLRPHLKL